MSDTSEHQIVPRPDDQLGFVLPPNGGPLACMVSDILSLATAAMPDESQKIPAILLIEDDEQFTDTIATLLRRNFKVTTGANGIDGVRAVMQWDFDVILCDIVMPQMPGDMFYLALQRIKPHLCDRVIFHTGNSGNPKVMHFLESTGRPFLFKPVQFADMEAAILPILQRVLPGWCARSRWAREQNTKRQPIHP